MHRRIGLALLAFIVLPLSIRAQSVEGNWKFNYVINGNFEQALAIVALKDDNGKVSGELVASRVSNPAFGSVSKDGGMLYVTLGGDNAGVAAGACDADQHGAVLRRQQRERHHRAPVKKEGAAEAAPSPPLIVIT